jgi:hypothetical protein
VVVGLRIAQEKLHPSQLGAKLGHSFLERSIPGVLGLVWLTLNWALLLYLNLKLFRKV